MSKGFEQTRACRSGLQDSIAPAVYRTIAFHLGAELVERHGAEPSETWAGRGKKPRWLTAQLKSGKRIDGFRIDLAAA